jgi:hypothetical protein
MLRASPIRAVPAFLLLAFIAAPATAEDAAGTAPAAPVKGEFDNSCAMGLAEGQTIKTDCAVNWTSPGFGQHRSHFLVRSKIPKQHRPHFLENGTFPKQHRTHFLEKTSKTKLQSSVSEAITTLRLFSEV